ncbi:MAG: hypothetical protein PHP74_03310 [Candidatus Gracilibacteria bacterium]|nr:hypothetical protein [Candidatus Gracilibacteria bacterium]
MQRYENNPILLNSIDDFALSGEELGEMRFSKGAEKTRLSYLSENPLKGRENDYPLQERKGDTPVCEEWILTENIGQNWAPWYTISIFARKFKSEEDFLNMEEKIKNMPSPQIEYLLKKLYHENSFVTRKNIAFNIFSKSPFIIDLVGGHITPHTLRVVEHRRRVSLYQKKRGLNFVRGNFDHLRKKEDLKF